MKKNALISLVCSVLSLASGCGSDESDSGAASGAAGGAGVAQGGAQDFGEFRQILDDGGLPHPATLDDVGFFNEHKVEFPAPTCSDDVCLHGQLGVMGNMITGSNCTLMLLGMNTAIDPTTLERPPLNLSIAVDVSGSMRGTNITSLREGLFRMLDDLRPEDRVSLIAFDGTAEILVENVAGDDPEFSEAIGLIEAGGSTNIYAGLREAYDTVQAHAVEGYQNRVILLSDGEATSGITEDARVAEMSRQYNELGFGLTTIGIGQSFDPELMRELAVTGGGAFYFLENPEAVREVFEEEVQAFLLPLATDVRIDVSVSDGYSLRAIYGTQGAELAGNEASIDIPALQLAHRTATDDDAGGRRGGGGAIIAEVTPLDASVGPGSVGTLVMSYSVPGSEETVVQEVPITSALPPGDTPDNGEFESTGVEKAFVMLNIYAGFDMAATRSAYGDLSGALGVLQPLRESVSLWLERNDDADIEDDLRYIDLFIANLQRRGAATPPPERRPPEIWPLD
ncbi:MAG: vWA domain-containing protein [Nannocystales bacterium]